MHDPRKTSVRISTRGAVGPRSTLRNSAPRRSSREGITEECPTRNLKITPPPGLLPSRDGHGVRPSAIPSGRSAIFQTRSMTKRASVPNIASKIRQQSTAHIVARDVQNIMDIGEALRGHKSQIARRVVSRARFGRVRFVSRWGTRTGKVRY